MKIDYENFKKSFVHVFANITDTKKYENKRTTNKLLQMMFLSVTNQFRTPLNAFTNVLQILEANYISELEILQPLLKINKGYK